MEREVGIVRFVEVKVLGLRVSSQEGIGELRSLTLSLALAQGSGSQTMRRVSGMRALTSLSEQTHTSSLPKLLCHNITSQIATWWGKTN